MAQDLKAEAESVSKIKNENIKLVTTSMQEDRTELE